MYFVCDMKCVMGRDLHYYRKSYNEELEEDCDIMNDIKIVLNKYII